MSGKAAVLVAPEAKTNAIELDRSQTQRPRSSAGTPALFVIALALLFLPAGHAADASNVTLDSDRILVIDGDDAHAAL